MKTTSYPKKSIEQQMRERAFKTKEPVDRSMVMLVICLAVLLISIVGVIYCAIKLHH